MAIALDHTIVPSRDKEAGARFFAEMFGLEYSGPWGHFAPVKVGNTSFDWDNREQFESHHYAFLVTDAEFDAVFGRVKDKGLDYWADPAKAHPGQINRHDGGRGVYFPDPDGHLLEIITRPYGSGG